MKPHLNTLFVTTEGAYIHREQETIRVRVEGECKLHIPMHHIQQIVCIGHNILVSPSLMAKFAKESKSISFLDGYGRFQARVEGIPGGNVLLRKQQYRIADQEEVSLALSKNFILGKMTNARNYLLHANRDSQSPDKDKISKNIETLKKHIRLAAQVDTKDSLRGFEGIAAKTYFATLPSLIRKKPFHFKGRSRRPPKDPTNALLSFGYAMLMQDCTAALSAVGLDPAVGLFHGLRPGRMALALDMMEELRTPIVDRLVLSLINKAIIKKTHFTLQPSGACLLGEAGRKEFLSQYHKAKQRILTHPFIEQKITWGKVPHIQALLLARTLRGDLDAYPPFLLRA